MNFDDHHKTGIKTAVFIAVSAGAFGGTTEDILVSGILCYAGSIFPDIDTQSTPSKVFAFVVVVAAAYFFFTKQFALAVGIPVVFASLKMSKHRGITHKYWFPLVLIIVSNWVGYWFYFVAFSAGLLAHYYLDEINPFTKKAWGLT